MKGRAVPLRKGRPLFNQIFSQAIFMSMEQPISRYEAIELVIPASSTATKFNFLDIPQLRSDQEKDIAIRGLEVFILEAVPLSFNGNALAPFAQLQKAFLTLYIEGEERLFRIPLVRLLSLDTAAVAIYGAYGFPLFDNLRVDWTKSYVSTPVAFGVGTVMSFLFGVSYARYAPGTLANIKKAQALAQNTPQTV